MKKILLSLAFTGAVFSAKAQLNQKTSSRELASSSTSNAKEDPHNPLVNGIPYSQYKNQVQAENKEKAGEKSRAEADQKKELEKMNSVKIQPIQSFQKSKSEENTSSKK